MERLITPRQQHRRWRADVQDLVDRIERGWPGVEAVTYVDHPWPGWDGRSADFWADAETWTPASLTELRQIRKFIMVQQGAPWVRHTILRHRLWTSTGGAMRWEPPDHSGQLLHLHVTWW